MTPARRYREVGNGTASRERLLVLLLQAARSAMQSAEASLKAGPQEARAADVALIRASDIVAELMDTLDPSHAPDLARMLGELYAFVTWRLLTARRTREATPVQEALRAFQPIVEAFEQVVAGQAEAAAR